MTSQIDESIESREEQVGTYPNAIWLDQKRREAADHAGRDFRINGSVNLLETVRKLEKRWCWL